MLQVPTAEGKVDMGECVVGRPRDLRTLVQGTLNSAPGNFQRSPHNLQRGSGCDFKPCASRREKGTREEPDKNTFIMNLSPLLQEACLA